MIFILFFKLIPCPIHWIVYVLAYLDFIMNFKAVLALPKTADSAQTHKSFIWIVWSTLHVYVWSGSRAVLEDQQRKKLIKRVAKVLLS